jgi:hypothetical protein
MSKAVLFIAAILFLTTGFQEPKDKPAQPTKPTPMRVGRGGGVGPGEDSSGWSVFSPKSSGCSVMLPGKPKQEPSGDTEYGRVPSTRYSLTSGKFLYALTYMDYPHSQESLEARVKYLEMVSETGITKFGGKLVSSKAVSLGEYPGREVTATVEGHFYTGRTYIANQKLYTLQVFVIGGERGSANAAKFFDSFKMLPAE